MKLSLKSLLIMGMMLLMVSCNTMQGLGQDLQSVGTTLENAASDAS